jgi:hypothetical protein
VAIITIVCKADSRAPIEAKVTKTTGIKQATIGTIGVDKTETIGPHQTRTKTILGEVITMMISTKATTTKLKIMMKNIVGITTAEIITIEITKMIKTTTEETAMTELIMMKNIDS